MVRKSRFSRAEADAIHSGWICCFIESTEAVEASDVDTMLIRPKAKKAKDGGCQGPGLVAGWRE
jgi:hypothetical protein